MYIHRHEPICMYKYMSYIPLIRNLNEVTRCGASQKIHNMQYKNTINISHTVLKVTQN